VQLRPLDVSLPIPASRVAGDPGALPAGLGAGRLAPRPDAPASGPLRYGGARALRQPRHLAGPRPPRGARRMGIPGARRSRALVRGARWVAAMIALIAVPALQGQGPIRSRCAGRGRRSTSRGPRAGRATSPGTAASTWAGISGERTTDAYGGFTIVFPDGGGRYELTARFIGMDPVQITVARQADEDRIEATIRMGLLVVALEPVTVSARSGSRSERAGPGG